MTAASCRVPAADNAPEGRPVSLFEACVEVLGSARDGNRSSAAEYVRTVQLAAASVPPAEPFPEPWSQESIEAVMTRGTEEEFEAMLASQQIFSKRLVAEYSDGERAMAIGRLRPAKSRRSGK